MKEIIAELIKNLGEYFWQSILFVAVTLLILSKTKYPAIFDLVNTSSGLTKFITIIVLLIAFWYVFFIAINFIKNQLINYLNLKKQKQSTINNLYSIFKKQEVYRNECKILISLVKNDIKEFDLEIIQKIAYIEEQTKVKNTPSLYNSTIDVYSYTFVEIIKKALYQLVELEILEYKSMTFYKIKDEIFDEVQKWI